MAVAAYKQKQGTEKQCKKVTNKTPEHLTGNSTV